MYEVAGAGIDVALELEAEHATHDVQTCFVALVVVRPRDRSRISLDLAGPEERKAKVVLGAMIDMAVRHDALPVNPVRQTSRVRRIKTETRSLTVKDLATVRAAVRAWMAKDRPGSKPTSDMADIIDLMLATGARIGEVLALRWGDIDLDAPRPNLTINGTIKTEPGKGTYRKASPKSAAGVRTVVLPGFAVQALLRRRESARVSRYDAVFPTRNGT
jgi:integrase